MKPTNIFPGQSTAGAVESDDPQSFLKNLATAINRNELCLHYQPRYELLTGKAHVLEALVRWQRPSVGLLYPETFITAAEKHGLIFQLDLYVFEQCCRDLLWIRQQLDDSVRLAVNFSVLSCESVYFSQKILEIAARHDLTMADFVLEITVSTHSHDIRKIRAFCETQANFGAQICLDDFGTGQSPLLNLYELPVHSVIIDRVFVNDIGVSQRSESIIRHLVALARDLGIKTVAEGVEKKFQYRFLSDICCDQIQGHLLGRPVILEKLVNSITPG